MYIGSTFELDIDTNFNFLDERDIVDLYEEIASDILGKSLINIYFTTENGKELNDETFDLKVFNIAAVTPPSACFSFLLKPQFIDETDNINENDIYSVENKIIDTARQVVEEKLMKKDKEIDDFGEYEGQYNHNIINEYKPRNSRIEFIRHYQENGHMETQSRQENL